MILMKKKISSFVVVSVAVACCVWVLQPTHTSKESRPRAEVGMSSGDMLRVVCPDKHLATLDKQTYESILSAVEEASVSYAVEPELLLSVMVAESSCGIGSRSHRGALGLMQLMPTTAQWLGVRNPRGVRDNILGGAKYLEYLLESFDGDMELALAAYNAGPARVRQYRRIPPYKETRNYVKKVMGQYNELRSMKGAIRPI